LIDNRSLELFRVLSGFRFVLLTLAFGNDLSQWRVIILVIRYICTGSSSSLCASHLRLFSISILNFRLFLSFLRKRIGYNSLGNINSFISLSSLTFTKQILSVTLIIILNLTWNMRFLWLGTWNLRFLWLGNFAFHLLVISLLICILKILWFGRIKGLSELITFTGLSLHLWFTFGLVYFVLWIFSRFTNIILLNRLVQLRSSISISQSLGGFLRKLSHRNLANIGNFLNLEILNLWTDWLYSTNLFINLFIKLWTIWFTWTMITILLLLLLLIQSL
jgi:hypothetical protein